MTFSLVLSDNDNDDDDDTSGDECDGKHRDQITWFV